MTDIDNCVQLRRPLVGAAACFACGMAVGATGLLPAGPVLLADLLALLLAGLFRRRAVASTLLFLCVGGLGAAHFIVGTEVVSQASIRSLRIDPDGCGARFIGRVADAPRFQPYRTGTRGCWVFPLQCEGIGDDGGWLTMHGRIEVRLAGRTSEPVARYGERLLVAGWLAPRDFSLAGERLSLDVSSKDGFRLLDGPPTFNPLAWALELRMAGARALSRGIEHEPAHASVLKALVLGLRKEMPADLYRQFALTGTLHIFAISGLHVGIAAVFIIAILKSIGVPRDRWGIALVPALLFYVAATGMASSALRAAVMAAVYFASPLFRRKPDVPSAVAAAAILILCFRSEAILSAGFIYSFTVVAFIVMFFSVAPRRLLGLEADSGEGTATARLRPVWIYFASLGVTTVAAFIASVPITALFFGNFSGVSLVANLLVVPLTFLIVLAGWLSLASSVMAPFVGEIFNHAANVFIGCLLRVESYLSGLPGACFQVSPPSLVAVLLWYAGWIALLLHARNAGQRCLASSVVLFAVLWTLLPGMMPQ